MKVIVFFLIRLKVKVKLIELFTTLQIGCVPLFSNKSTEAIFKINNFCTHLNGQSSFFSMMLQSFPSKPLNQHLPIC